MNGAFVVANFADEPPAAMLDNCLSAQMTENTAEVARLLLQFAALAADAMTPQASLEMVEKMAGG